MRSAACMRGRAAAVVLTMAVDRRWRVLVFGCVGTGLARSVVLGSWSVEAAAPAVQHALAPHAPLQEWDAGEGLLPYGSSELGGYDSSAAQPSTPSAAYAQHDAVASALHGRLDVLAAERQQQQCAAAAVGTPSSSDASGAPSARSSPEQSVLAEDAE